MPDMHNNNLPLFITFALGIFNACVGPTGWFAMWNGIKDIFAGIAVLCAGVATWIWQTTADLGVSFGDYLCNQLAVAKLLHVVTTTGTWLQATGIVLSGLFVSYAVLALGYSVWTFSLYPNTVSQQVLSVHGGHVFLPLVLAWIVLGVVTFVPEDQGNQKTDGNDQDDTPGDQPSVNSENKPVQTDGKDNEKALQSGVSSDVGVASGADNALGRSSVGCPPNSLTKEGVSTSALIAANVSGTAFGGVATPAHDVAQVGGIAGTGAEVGRPHNHDNSTLDLEGTARGQPSARQQNADNSAETTDMDTTS